MSSSLPKISVIVPYFNAENYLRNCIASIISQNIVEIEVLLVDDGSTDGSRLEADELSKKDSRIRVFHKKRGGVSSARNVGIEFARGEYITFVDVDDTLAPGALQESLLLGDYDVVRIPSNYSSLMKTYPSDIVCRNRSEVENFLKKNYCNACWARLYKKVLIGSTRFDEKLQMGEDILFFVELYPRIKTYHLISGNNGYQYTIDNEISLTHSIGCSAGLGYLIERLHLFCKKHNSLAWSYLLDACFVNSQRFGLLPEYYKSFEFREVVFAPLDIRMKCRLLKLITKYKFFA